MDYRIIIKNYDKYLFFYLRDLLNLRENYWLADLADLGDFFCYSLKDLHITFTHRISTKHISTQRIS